MTKFKSFISWFPKMFEKATHEENLEQISSSISSTLVNSKMNGEFLTAGEIEFILNHLRKNLILEMEIKKSSEIFYVNNLKFQIEESTNKIEKYDQLIKSLS